MCDDWDLPTRIKLDISASSPVIIVPISSQHKEVLIIDLGNLSITNTFKWSDSVEQIYSDETQSKFKIYFSHLFCSLLLR